MLVKKKYLSICFLVMALLFVSACSSEQTEGSSNGDDTSDGGEASASEETYEIIANTWYPSTHPNVVNALEPWAELVNEETDGRVEVEVLSGAVLGGAGTIMEDVSGGVYDVSISVYGAYQDTDVFKYSLLMLPFAFSNAMDASNVATEFKKVHGDNVWGEDIVEANVLGAIDPMMLFSTKPIDSVEDLKGMQIQVPDVVLSKMVESWGATPLSLPLNETYEALDRGLMDAIIYPPTGALGYGYQEIAPYIVDFGINTPLISAMMSREALEKLPEDLKQMFEDDLLSKLAEMIRDSYISELESVWPKLEESIEGKGEIITLSPEAEEEFRQSAKPLWDEWIEEANSKGYEGQQMMDDLFQLMEDEGIQPPF